MGLASSAYEYFEGRVIGGYVYPGACYLTGFAILIEPFLFAVLAYLFVTKDRLVPAVLAGTLALLALPLAVWARAYYKSLEDYDGSGHLRLNSNHFVIHEAFAGLPKALSLPLCLWWLAHFVCALGIGAAATYFLTVNIEGEGEPFHSATMRLLIAVMMPICSVFADCYFVAAASCYVRDKAVIRRIITCLIVFNIAFGFVAPGIAGHVANLTEVDLDVRKH